METNRISRIGKLLAILFVSISIATSAQIVPGVVASAGTVSSPAYDGGLVTNGDFSNGSTGWTIATGSVTNGEYVCSSVASYTVLLSQTLSLSYGSTYRVEFTITNYSAGLLAVLIGDMNGQYDVTWDQQKSANGTYSVDIIHDNTSAAHVLQFYAEDATTTLHIDNVKVTLAP